MSDWISIEDRLPNLKEYCMVYMSRRGSDITNFTITQFTKYGFERACVSHWMPLPKPPKEQGE